MKKKDIIPDDIKENIDDILEKELFNVNRYYAESNIDISKLMTEEIKCNPEEFLYKLKNRWLWHNSFYEDLLEPAYMQIFDKNIIEFTPKNIKEIIDIYKSIVLVDQATLVMSASIKKYLLSYAEAALTNIEESKKEKILTLLLTCSKENFFVQYHREHIEYIILEKINYKKLTEYKKYLIDKYHIGDTKIFEGRMKKYTPYFKYSESQLFDILDSLKTNDQFVFEQRKFVFRSSELLAFNKIVEFDNIDEKIISHNFIGISGFLFRKKILEMLNKENILKNKGYIYEFSDEIVLNSLEKLYIQRSKKMEKNVKPLRQKGPTCAIMCMLMVLEYYKAIPKVNWYDERQYYKKLRSLYMEGTPLSAVALVLAQNNLETVLLHSEKDYFTNNNHYLDEQTFKNTMKEYKAFADNAKKNGAEIKNDIDINTDKIKEYLEKDYIVILSGMVGIALHAILVVGYDENKFCVCNPLYKEKQYINKKDLESYMETPIGKWCILVKEKTKEKDALIEQTDKYKEEAEKMINQKSKKERRIEK